jgi:hypothetical protein
MVNTLNLIPGSGARKYGVLATRSCKITPILFSMCLPLRLTACNNSGITRQIFTKFRIYEILCWGILLKCVDPYQFWLNRISISDSLYEEVCGFVWNMCRGGVMLNLRFIYFVDSLIGQTKFVRFANKSNQRKPRLILKYARCCWRPCRLGLAKLFIAVLVSWHALRCHVWDSCDGDYEDCCLSTFRRNILTLSSGLKSAVMKIEAACFSDVGNDLPIYTALRPKRQQSSFWYVFVDSFQSAHD